MNLVYKFKNSIKQQAGVSEANFNFVWNFMFMNLQKTSTSLSSKNFCGQEKLII